MKSGTPFGSAQGEWGADARLVAPCFVSYLLPGSADSV